MCIYKIYISFINLHHIKIYNVKYILFVSQNFKLKSPSSTTNGFCSLLPTTDPKKGKSFFAPRRTAQRFGIIPEGRAVGWGTGMMQPKLVTKPPASRAPLRGDRASCCPAASSPSHLSPPASLKQNLRRGKQLFCPELPLGEQHPVSQELTPDPAIHSLAVLHP